MGRGAKVYTKVLSIRLKPEELEEAKKLWQKDRPQVTFSEWCRERIIKRAIPRPIFSDVDETKKFLATLSRLGSNVNQIARAANINGVADFDEAKKEVNQIWQLVSRKMR